MPAKLKKLSLSLVLFTSIIGVNAQDYKSLYNKLTSFTSFSQYDSVDQEIVSVCNFLLSRPLIRKDYPQDYYYALKDLHQWCSNIESYRILVFGKVIDANRDDALLQNMYMAAMAKYLLEQRYVRNRYVFPVKKPNIEYGDLPEVRETLLEGARIFFDYLKNTSGVNPNRQLKDGIEAFETGTLEKYMFDTN
jgi:hypothetical protein